jgi:hypothetical protein
MIVSLLDEQQQDEAALAALNASFTAYKTMTENRIAQLESAVGFSSLIQC